MAWGFWSCGQGYDYEGHNVSFVVDGDTLKVMADVSVEVVEEQFTNVITGPIQELQAELGMKTSLLR